MLVPIDDARAALLWLAERPDSTEAPDGGAGEPSQQETYRWIEAVIVDLARGKARGPVVALSAKDGHAQAFTARLIDDALYLAVRDDARPTDGDGGSVYVVISAVPKTTEPAGSLGAPHVLARVDQGVAAGQPAIALEPKPWLFWLGPDDDARLLPAHAPPGTPPSKEPQLDGERIVAQRGGVMLTSRLIGAGIELALQRCVAR